MDNQAEPNKEEIQIDRQTDRIFPVFITILQAAEKRK
jgi:hypothetical protein